ncbi:transporter substrate-binding domain-containing protein [Tissierella creatinophila]|uniref:Putative amino-acid ABC transporter-binding protein n=1 Tax=Tissierella creatinophila DSM 6911 TaxID=1123403 RepID=A0A1U7M2E8_TISCR|nr:transporter substrate-binding domain-containing protein [Tissierella creatinophila]OLS01493.1 putative amino-acid ABC transporter-binding protein precursor [Tissierella creatinophila DSM 6911]
MKSKLKFMLLILLLVSTVLAGCSKNKADDSTDLSDGKKEVLVIGTEGTYQPFTYHNEKGELVGYDVEIGKAIAEEIGMEAKFMEITWEGLLAGLDNGQVDIVVNQVGVTKEREEKYIFSEPYLYSYPALIVKSDNDSINSFEDAKGLTTSLNVSSNYALIAEDYGIEIIPSETFSKDIELLLAGRTDVVVNDTVAFADYLKQKPDTPIKIAATLDKANTVAIPIRKKDVDLKEKINNAIITLRENGRLKEISEKYLDKDLTTPESN